MWKQNSNHSLIVTSIKSLWRHPYLCPSNKKKVNKISMSSHNSKFWLRGNKNKKIFNKLGSKNGKQTWVFNCFGQLFNLEGSTNFLRQMVRKYLLLRKCVLNTLLLQHKIEKWRANNREVPWYSPNPEEGFSEVVSRKLIELCSASWSSLVEACSHCCDGIWVPWVIVFVYISCDGIWVPLSSCGGFSSMPMVGVWLPIVCSNVGVCACCPAESRAHWFCDEV